MSIYTRIVLYGYLLITLYQAFDSGFSWYLKAPILIVGLVIISLTLKRDFRLGGKKTTVRTSVQPEKTVPCHYCQNCSACHGTGLISKK